MSEGLALKDDAARAAGDMAAAVRDYAAYGMRIRSDLAIPEFAHAPAAAAGSPPDLVIARGAIGEAVPPTMGLRSGVYAGETRSVILGGIGGFRIARRDRVTYQPYPGFDERLLSLAVIGPVMALLLDMRGMLVLHGSAIDFGGGAGAALFVGDKGAGKSTTAAACIAAGFRLLTDDVLAVAFKGAGAGAGEANVVPGFPQVKLTDEAADWFALDAVTPIETPVEGFGKQRLRLDRPFDPAPVAARCVYVLDRGDTLAVEELRGPDALAAIMRFSYLPRFGTPAMAGGAAVRHLRDCAALTGAARVCRLTVPADLERLGAVVAFVGRDLVGGGG